MFENVTKKQALDIIKRESVVVLDVRTKQEFSLKHFAGAINIDIYQENFEEKLNALDKTKTYVVYCRSGNRSGSAMEFMQQAGFSTVFNVMGSFV